MQNSNHASGVAIDYLQAIMSRAKANSKEKENSMDFGTLEEYVSHHDVKPRKVDNVLRDNKYTQVYVIDEPGAGGACHHYIVVAIESGCILAHINHQNGPIQENGVNGLHGEDLLTIQRHRLQGFQSGDYKCRANAISLTKLEESTFWLNQRTAEREGRGVEGKSVK